MPRMENKVQKANRLALEALPEVVRATLAPIGYAMTDESVWSVLEKKGFAEVNKTIKDAEGRFATRATTLGIEQVPKGDRDMPEENVSAPAVFTIEDVPVVETPRASGGKVSLYPFDALNVGQSFFVPATEAKPEPWKSMKGTISSANSRYSELAKNEDGSPVMRIKTRGANKGEEVQATVQTRKFAIGKDTKDDVAGARIGRVL